MRRENFDILNVGIFTQLAGCGACLARTALEKAGEHHSFGHWISRHAVIFMTISITPVWRDRAMEDEFNQRQMLGQPCDDLVRLMVKVISPAKRTSEGRYDHRGDYLYGRRAETDGIIQPTAAARASGL